MRAATTTPVDAAPAFHARLGTAIGLPRCYGESASTTAFRGLLGVHSRCGPHDLLASYEAFSGSASVHSLPPEPLPVLPAGARVSPGRTFTDGSTVPLQGTHNNHCENRIRPWALGRRNWLFIGSQLAGERAAVVMSLLQSAKLNGHEPWTYLKDVLTRLPTQLNSRIEELLPHRWQPAG
jgi:hypothetical protein